MENNCIFSGKWEVTHDQINCHLGEHLLLKTCVVELKGLLGLQQTALQHCQDMIAGLEETIVQLVMSVKKLEKTVIGHYFYSYFLSIFNPTSLHIPYPTFPPYAYPCCVFLLHTYPHHTFFSYAFTFTNRRQECDSIGTTGHRTTHLLSYQHPETVLLWFLLTQILHWNLLCCHRTLPPLKVPDFPDTEYE